MAVIWVTLVIVFISGCLARRYNNPTTIDGITVSNPNHSFVFLAMAVLVLVSGLRRNIGDTGYYIFTYINLIPDNIASAFKQFTLFHGDPGFYVFQSFIKEFISSDPQVFIFICSLTTNIMIVTILYKYSPIFELSLFLYIASGSYLATMNGIRQYLVSAILFLCLKLITDGKLLPFFIIIFLVSTMHTSALIFIPVYFFVRLKPWSRLIGITLIASVLIFSLFSTIGSSLLGLLSGTQYGHYEVEILQEGGGANFIRAFVAAVPVLLAFWGREQIAINNDKLLNIVVNFNVLNLVFYILAIQNWIFARMCMYFGLYSLLLLPWLIKNLFDGRTRAILYCSSIILYIIYFYFEMESYLNFWGIGYRSDYIGF